MEKRGDSRGLESIERPFPIALAAGVGTSIVALSGFLHHLLEHHKAALFAFFFGLVAASIPLVGREITQRNAAIAALFIAGAAITFGVGSLPPLQVEPSLAYLFACGAVAACAMILPGISGSFILLLLGVYSAVIGALKELDLVVIATVGAGAVSGLLGFSKGPKHARLDRNQVMAMLTGLLLGSLQALGPGRKTHSSFTPTATAETWLQTNAWPSPVNCSFASPVLQPVQGWSLPCSGSETDWPHEHHPPVCVWSITGPQPFTGLVCRPIQRLEHR